MTRTMDRLRAAMERDRQDRAMRCTAWSVGLAASAVVATLLVVRFWQ